MSEAVPILDVGIHELFARQAARRPQAIAVRDASGHLTYAELEGRAASIAAQLRQHGLQAEQPVLVLTDRSVGLLANLLGILAAGGCYVPIDANDPPDRSRHILSIARCSIVLGRRDQIRRFQEHLKFSDHAIQFLSVEDLASQPSPSHPIPLLPGQTEHSNLIAPGGRRLAYILFTSGSTGLPKGVEVEHRNLVNLLLAVRDLLEFTESDRYLAISKVGFDVSAAELFLPLVCGGQVIVYPTELVMQPRELAATLVREEITFFQTGPSVWSILLNEIRNFPRLRVAISTGEAIAPALAQRLASTADAVWNLYGPTETTVWATGHKLEAASSEEMATRSVVSAPIGRPFLNVTVQILDDQQRPVPPETEGELWIGGEAVARGYCNHPKLTDERFVVLGEKSERFYRTGDVVTRSRDGRLHYFGRNDDQIKVRGVRIEPMEVEAAILKHPQVASAAATWFETNNGARSIVAAVVGRPNHQLNSESLHRHLQDLLNPAVIPSRFLFCDVLPISPNGKIDRKAIRARALDQPKAAAEHSAPEDLTPTEQELIRIWEKTLNVKPISRDHHFFTIGGDSLSAVTMLLEAESSFDLSLSVRTVFESPTVRKLAAHIDRSRRQVQNHGDNAFVFPLSPQGRGNAVFFCGVDLKMARQGMWNADCPLYSVSLWAQGTGFVDAASMEDLARIEIESIRSIQPIGPYRLAGYSFGGLLALEMAQQLRRAGEKVDLLFLLNPGEPSRRAAPASAPGHVQRGNANADGSSTASLPARAANRRISPFQSWLKEAWQWFSYYRVHLYGRHRNPISTMLLPKDRWPAVWYAAKRLAKSYAPQPYDGRVLIVLDADLPRPTRWAELLPLAADLQYLKSSADGWFDEPTHTEWMNFLRSKIES